MLDDPQMHIFIANINWNWKVVFAVFLMSIILMGSQIEAIHFVLLMFEAALAFAKTKEKMRDWTGGLFLWAICRLSQTATPVHFHVIFETLRVPILDFISMECGSLNVDAGQWRIFPSNECLPFSTFKTKT